MAYTKTTWTNASTALNQTNLNNLETQYTEASLSFGPDLFTAGFVLTGFAGTGTGTSTLSVTAGTAYILQSDGTTRQRSITSSTQTTSTPSTTYHLYLQPDGTWYWSTSNSPAANSLAIADVATNGAGNISSITDTRSKRIIFFNSAIGGFQFPNSLQITGADSAANVYTAFLPSLPGAGQTSVIRALVTGDGSARAALQLRSDGYGQLSLGNVTNTRTIHATSAGITLDNATTIATGGLTITAGGATITAGGLTVTAGATSLDGAKLTTDGNGVLTKIGNQASAGSFGAPVVVAQVINRNVVNTSTTDLVTFTPPADGLYRLTGTFLVNGTNNGASVNFYANYTEPNLNSSVSEGVITWNSAGTVVAISNATITKGIVNPIAPLNFYAKSGQVITIRYSNAAAATINDFVSAVIERLS